MEEKKRLVSANEYVKPTCDKDWLQVSKVWHHEKDSSRPDRDPSNLKKKFLDLASKSDNDKVDGDLVKKIRLYEMEECKRNSVESSARAVSCACLLLLSFSWKTACVLLIVAHRNCLAMNFLVFCITATLSEHHQHHE
jgi:hypothetical protein